MFPKLFEFEIFGHPIVIGSYGVMMSVGYLAALVVIYRRSAFLKIDRDDMLDLLFWILVSSIIGSRIMYVLTNPENFSTRPLSVFAFWDGGFVFYGGVIAALGVGALVVKLKSIPFLKAADGIAPGLSIGHALGRLGCYGVGCCWGKPATGILYTRFPSESVAMDDLQNKGVLAVTASETMPLHPVQLYESLGEVAIFMGILYLERKKPFHGGVIFFYLIAYGVLRFVTEIFRGDPTRGYIKKLETPLLNKYLSIPEGAPSFLSTSQMVSIIICFVTVTALILLYRRRSKERNGFSPHLLK